MHILCIGTVVFLDIYSQNLFRNKISLFSYIVYQNSFIALVFIFCCKICHLSYYRPMALRLPMALRRPMALRLPLKPVNCFGNPVRQ